MCPLPVHLQVVVKFLRKASILPDGWVEDEEMGVVPREIALLARITHPHIVEVHYVYAYVVTLYFSLCCDWYVCTYVCVHHPQLVNFLLPMASLCSVSSHFLSLLLLPSSPSPPLVLSSPALLYLSPSSLPPSVPIPTSPPSLPPVARSIREPPLLPDGHVQTRRRHGPVFLH